MGFPRDKLPARFRSLAVLEALNAIWLPAVLLGAVAGGAWTLPNLCGALVLSLVLLVGAAYWAQKLRQLRTRARLPRWMPLFSACSRLGWPIMAAAIVGAVWLGWGRPWREWWPGLWMAVFAVVEQVNYFVLQLSYDNRYDLRHLRDKGFRRPKLRQDLQTWRADQAAAND